MSGYQAEMMQKLTQSNAAIYFMQYMCYAG